MGYNAISMAMTKRNRLIGGTYHRKKAYVLRLNFREYPHKIWPNIWYERTSIFSIDMLRLFVL